jgi:hypothetical protein
MGAPDRLSHIWYQSFNQLEIASTLVGATRETCRAYIGHFLRNWAHRKQAHDDVLEAYVDNFLKPGNLEGGFAHYKAAHAGRIAMMKGEAPSLPPIATPTCVRWAEHDPLFPYLGRPPWRDLHQSRPCIVSRGRPFPAPRGPGSDGTGNRHVLFAEEPRKGRSAPMKQERFGSPYRVIFRRRGSVNRLSQHASWNGHDFMVESAAIACPRSESASSLCPVDAFKQPRCHQANA